MTNISNSFAYDFCQLPSKYTISTLQFVNIADNQDSYGCIWKFSRFSGELERKLCYDFKSISISQLYGCATIWIASAKLVIFFELEAWLKRLVSYRNTFAINSV